MKWLSFVYASIAIYHLGVPSTESAANPGIKTNSLGMKLVLIPAGRFEMGSPPREANRLSDEGPVHTVRITEQFYLDMHEVTVGEFRRFVKSTGYTTDAERGTAGYHDGKPGGYSLKGEAKWVFVDGLNWKHPGFTQTDRHPVVLVSYQDAMAFCAWLSRKELKTYRLPTEAEWEYACRAGTSTPYWHGGDVEGLSKIGNVADASARRKLPFLDFTIASDDGYIFTSPVGKYRANAFELKDMHGNASEWCADWYDAKYYATSPRDNPPGPAQGSRRVVRGGGWGSQPYGIRSAYRFASLPEHRSVGVGFRVVLELEQIRRENAEPASTE